MWPIGTLAAAALLIRRTNAMALFENTMVFYDSPDCLGGWTYEIPIPVNDLARMPAGSIEEYAYMSFQVFTRPDIKSSDAFAEQMRFRFMGVNGTTQWLEDTHKSDNYPPEGTSVVPSTIAKGMKARDAAAIGFGFCYNLHEYIAQKDAPFECWTTGHGGTRTLVWPEGVSKKPAHTQAPTASRSDAQMSSGRLAHQSGRRRLTWIISWINPWS